MISKAPIFILLVFVGTLFQSASAQQQGSGFAIRGQLLDDMNGSGIVRVRVTLSGSSVRDPIPVFSENEGIFQFPNLASGKYRLNFEKAGYFAQTTAEMEIRNGAEADLGRIVLTTKHAIAGVVRWQNNEPVSTAQVRVMVVQNGLFDSQGASDTTNDKGEFDFEGLRPGHYVIVAVPPGPRAAINAAARITTIENPRLAQPVFFPASSVLNPSSALDLRGVKDMQHIDLILQETRGGQIEGKVLTSASFAAGSNINLRLLSSSGISLPLSTSVKAGEPFKIGPAAEGPYLVDLSGQTSGGVARSIRSIYVGPEGLRNADLNPPEPTFISGKIETADPAAARSLRIQARSDRYFDSQTTAMISAIGDGIFISNPSVNPTSGEFRITGLIPGEMYRLTFQGTPPGTWISAVVQGSGDPVEAPFTVVEGGDPLHVFLRNDAGSIEGVVQGTSAAAPAFVVLAPKDRRLQHRFRNATTDTQGKFRILSVAPGDYDLFPLDHADSYPDDSFLSEIRAPAVTVRVEPGAKTLLEVQKIETFRR